MLKELPRNLIYQDYENRNEMLEGDNASLNKELLRLYHDISIESGVEYDALDIINGAWYVTKWVAMQKEPYVQSFYLEIKKYIQGNSFNLLPVMLSYCIFSLQEKLPQSLEEFMPDMLSVIKQQLERLSTDEPRMQWEKTQRIFEDWLNRKHAVKYNTVLHLELKKLWHKDLKMVTNDFSMNDIKELLLLYPSMEAQLFLVNTIKNAYVTFHQELLSRSINELPF